MKTRDYQKWSKDTRMVNEKLRFVRINRFENSTLGINPRIKVGINLRTDRFNPQGPDPPFKPRREPTVLSAVKKAGSNLEGGLRSSLEGLGYSGTPCTEVLSVAGFLALRCMFLAGRTVYSQLETDRK